MSDDREYTIDRMHKWAKAGDVVYCTKCMAGANDDPTQCPTMGSIIARQREEDEKAKQFTQDFK